MILEGFSQGFLKITNAIALTNQPTKLKNHYFSRLLLFKEYSNIYGFEVILSI